MYCKLYRISCRISRIWQQPSSLLFF